MMRALVLGLGRSGKAARALLLSRGMDVVALDKGDAFPAADGAPFAFAVVSPGLALSHPWIVAARARGIPLKSELQLGCETLKAQGVRLLAVTGSKGKSSVVKLVADALVATGVSAVACGNFGLPVTEVALSGAVQWAVVEVSSFMMETTLLPCDTFEAATILNLQEDHLDRHGSVEVYHALKRKLLSFATRTVVGADVLLDAALLEGSYFDNEVLRENGAAAVGLLRVAGLSDGQIRAAFQAFKPLPHRMNRVAKHRGVVFIDDSKATSLAALRAGVEMAATKARSVRLIAGGLGKGDDPRSVVPSLTKWVRKVYLIGDSAELFRSVWSAFVDCEVVGTMERAVETILREAVDGETVLLSPGTASFDQFKSFGERGDFFATLVNKGIQE